MCPASCALLQVFTGPPESVRDHVMAAARALSRGNWQQAYAYLTALKMWALMPDRDAVLEMLLAKLKEEALRIFLFTYGPQYAALSSAQLCQMFELDEKKVRCLGSARCQLSIQVWCWGLVNVAVEPADCVRAMHGKRCAMSGLCMTCALDDHSIADTGYIAK